jgi:transketolase N-terminal domain/subunit
MIMMKMMKMVVRVWITIMVITVDGEDDEGQQW